MSKILGIVATQINFLLSLLVLLIVLVNKEKIDFDNIIIQDIIRSWNLNPIIDISAEKKPCEYMNKDYLVNDGWNGTTNGCDCTKAESYFMLNSRKRLYNHLCQQNDTYMGCKSIQPIGDIQYSYWRGKILCVERMSKYSYQNFSLSYSETYDGCQQNYKPCGKLDTLGNFLCIPSNVECPINSIIISDSESTNPIISKYSYKSIGLNNNQTLYYTNQATTEPIILDLRTSEGNMCINFMEREKAVSYILEIDKPKYCSAWFNDGERYDSRYYEIDKLPKETVYFENRIYSLINDLPMFNSKILEGTVTLFNRPYIGWKKKCQDDSVYNMTMVHTSLILMFKKLNYLHSSLKVAAIIMFVLSFAPIVNSYKIKSILNATNIIAQLIFTVSALGFVIINFWVVSYHFSLKDHISQMIFNQCGDSHTNKLLNMIFESIEVSFDEVSLVASLVCLIMYPLLFVVSFFFMDEHKNVSLVDDN